MEIKKSIISDKEAEKFLKEFDKSIDSKEKEIKPITERRSITYGATNAVLTLNKKILDIYGFKEGKHYVTFEKGKITITESI